MAEIRFQRKLRKAGASLIISIPVEIEKTLALKEGQDVDLLVTVDRAIRLEPRKAK